MRAARAVELGELLPSMRRALRQAMSKNAGWILHGGVHSVHIGVESAVTLSHRGRPEPESGTPVNMENRLHCDNGEGVAATPPPYPLEFPLWKGCHCQDAPERARTRPRS